MDDSRLSTPCIEVVNEFETEHPRFDWERLICGPDGPPSGTRRHVLLALATHLDRDGMAWPSIATLAAETCLTERTVITHLERAVREGWIQREFKRRGKDWRHYVYTVTLPRSVAEARSVAK